MRPSRFVRYFLSSMAAALLTSGAAPAQPLFDELKGTDRITTAARGALHLRMQSEAIGTLALDAQGNVQYANTDGFSLGGRIDDSGRRPLLVLDPEDVAALRTAIAAKIEGDVPGLDVSEVALDERRLRARLSVRERGGDVTASLVLSLPFGITSNQGAADGKFVLGASLSSEPLCSVCGKRYAGIERFRQSLAGCGSIGGRGAALLVVDPDPENDGTSTWTFSDDEGLSSTGTLTQIGRTVSCSLDADSRAELEAQLSFLARNVCGAAGGVQILDEVCSGKPGKGGERASFGFGVSFTDADQGVGTSTTAGRFRRLP